MRAHETEFLENLYRAYYFRLTLYVQTVLGDEHRAEEIVQDTFHTAVLKIEALMQHPAPFAWLKRTAKNKALNSRTVQQRYERHFLQLSEELKKNLAAPDDVEQTVLARLVEEPTARARLRQLLSEEELFLLQKLVLEDATHLEVAKAMGITVWTCQKRWQRLRKKLDENLGK